jgi:hypothetical protein
MAFLALQVCLLASDNTAELSEWFGCIAITFRLFYSIERVELVSIHSVDVLPPRKETI